MKKIFKHFFYTVLVFGIAAGLFSCLNPINFNEGESLVTIDVNLSGTLDTNDITSAVLLLSNNSKSVDVTSVVITQPEWQPTKPTDTPPRWAFSGKPKRLEKKAQYLPPSDITYQVVVSYDYDALEGQSAKNGTQTLAVSLPLPKQTFEIFVYRGKDGKVIVATEIRDPHPTDTGIPADDPMEGEGSIPAIVPPQNRDKIASFIVVSMTRSQHIDTVNFKASDDRDYTIHGINASDRQSIALGQGAWKTKLVYTREGITNTIGPVNSIIVPSSDPQAVKEHYLYFYLNNLGDYTVSQTWPPVPNDVDENDLLPPDAGFGRSLIKIENKSYALAKTVTVVNERDPDKAPMVIYSDKFTPAVPVEYNKTGYVDVVGSEGFPIHAHEGYLVRVTMEVYGSEPVEIERQAYIKDQIIAITVEQKDLAGTPVPGAKVVLKNEISSHPIQIESLTVKNKTDPAQSVTYSNSAFMPQGIIHGPDQSADVMVISNAKMPITEGAEFEAVVSFMWKGTYLIRSTKTFDLEELYSTADPDQNVRTITITDADGIEIFNNSIGTKLIIENKISSYPVEIPYYIVIINIPPGTYSGGGPIGVFGEISPPYTMFGPDQSFYFWLPSAEERGDRFTAGLDLYIIGTDIHSGINFTWDDLYSTEYWEENEKIIIITDADVPKEIKDYFDFEMEMEYIPANKFMMSSPASEPGRDPYETQHQVTLTKGFYLGKYPVTQAQFNAVMGYNPSAFSPAGTQAGNVSGLNTDKFPVEMVSWYDALVFCNKLSIREGLSPAYSIAGSTNPGDWGSVPTQYNGLAALAGWDDVQIAADSNGYRLPTEAQWEYACRAGTTTVFYWGTDTISDTQANFDASSKLYNNSPAGILLGRTTQVGSYAPNAWGLYDMYGNVYEWCWDRYVFSPLPNEAQTDPSGPVIANSGRVIRGGCYASSGVDLRSAARTGMKPEFSELRIGFRVARPE